MLLPYCYRPMRNVSCVVCASLGRRLESSERVSCSTVFTITIYYMSPVIINQCRQSIGPCPAAGGRRVRTSHPAGTCAGWRVPELRGVQPGAGHCACSHTTSLVPRPLSTAQYSNLAVVAPSLACVMREIARGTNVSNSQKNVFRHHALAI